MKKLLLFFILLNFSSCTSIITDPYDAETLGKQYCECLGKNGAVKDNKYAEIICDAEFIKKSRYFKAYKVGVSEMETIPLKKSEEGYSLESEDSFRIFFDKFSDFIYGNCSWSYFYCKQDSIERANPNILLPSHSIFDFLIGIKTCKEAETLALKEAQEGKYRLIEWGLPDNDNFTEFYRIYLSQKYNIQRIQGGCVSFEVPDCYDKKMRELIIAKYKNALASNFFYSEAKKAFENLKQNKSSK